MKSGIHAIVAALLSTTLNAQEVLEFTGSFWDHGDSFILRFVLDESESRIEWDGHPQNLQERELPSEGRIRANFDLDAAERESLRDLTRRFHWCRSNVTVVGTGRLTRVVHSTDGKGSVIGSYFHTSPDERLARRGEFLPLVFQSLVADGDFSEPDRRIFFKELESLSSDLADYEEAYLLLEQARLAQDPVSWDEIAKRVVKPGLSQEFPEIAALMPRYQRESASAIDGMLKEPLTGAAAGRARALVVSVESVSVDHPDSGTVEVLPDAIESPTPDRWIGLPPSFRNFLEDYLQGPKGGVPIEWRTDFEIWGPGGKPAEDQVSRLEFLRRSGFLSYLVPVEGVAEREIGHLVIRGIRFEKNMTRCVIFTNARESRTPVVLLELENAEWNVLRRITYEDWDEYGWKAPPFQ